MKETQKQYIARLEKELQQAKNELADYKELCNNLNNEIVQMQERADKGFVNSSDYQQMNKRIEFLEMQNKQLETKNKSIDDGVHNLLDKYNNDNIHKLNNETVKVHNERGAGRKTKLTYQQQEEIKMYRIQGKTIKELAQMYNCSVGLIHKLINKQYS